MDTVALLTADVLAQRVAPSSRKIVRTAVGLAVVAPALGLLVLAVIFARDGGARGALAGLVVGLLALGLLGVALMMTYAPVTIAKLLRRSQEEEATPDEAPPGPNGREDGITSDREHEGDPPSQR